LAFLFLRIMFPAFLFIMGGVDPGWALDREDFKVRCLEIVNKDDRGVALNYPRSIFYDSYDRETYIVGSGKNEVVIFTDDFYPIISVGHGRGLKGVRSGAAGKESIFFCLGAVVNEKSNFLVEYDRALLPVARIDLVGFVGEEAFKPEQVVVRDGFFYVVGMGSPGLLKFDEEGSFVDMIVPHEEVLGVKEEAPVKFFAIDKEGRLFLLSEVMGRVYVYSSKGKFLFKFGTKGGSSGKLSRPRALALDESMGLVFVVDYMRHTVNVYSIYGEYIFEFGGKGDGRGWFAFPSGISIDGEGRLWVADTFNSRVQVFKISSDGRANKRELVEAEIQIEEVDVPEIKTPLDDEVELKAQARKKIKRAK